MSVFGKFTNGDLLDIKNEDSPFECFDGTDCGTSTEHVIEFSLIFSHDIRVDLLALDNRQGIDNYGTPYSAFFQSQSRLIPTFVKAIDESTSKTTIGDYVAMVLAGNLTDKVVATDPDFGGKIVVNGTVVAEITSASMFDAHAVAELINTAINEHLEQHKIHNNIL